MESEVEIVGEITEMEQKTVKPLFAVCLKNKGYSASLEPRKIYRVVPDDGAAQHKMIRVVDESGEDYLYPVDYFAPIALSKTLVEALALAA